MYFLFNRVVANEILVLKKFLFSFLNNSNTICSLLLIRILSLFGRVVVIRIHLSNNFSYSWVVQLRDESFERYYQISHELEHIVVHFRHKVTLACSRTHPIQLHTMLIGYQRI